MSIIINNVFVTKKFLLSVLLLSLISMVKVQSYSNPELAHEMSEIKKIKELEEYITVAQDIVEQIQE